MESKIVQQVFATKPRFARLSAVSGVHGILPQLGRGKIDGLRQISSLIPSLLEGARAGDDQIAWRLRNQGKAHADFCQFGWGNKDAQVPHPLVA